MWPGDPDLPMTATFIGDFGRALSDLGQHPAAAGQVFHVPVAPASTGREFIETLGNVAGTSPEVGRLTPGLIRLLKLIAPLPVKARSCSTHSNGHSFSTTAAFGSSPAASPPVGRTVSARPSPGTAPTLNVPVTGYCPEDPGRTGNGPD